ncbi:hypothetical protein CANCADRAFT_25844 [Tortispora caseinolytica NRRL Y-17796]|uniref:Phosphoglycerate mutase-like protein n=1 Tax=Tortispora caseinolytica NRRL Y-17796 TaxID=767744 RepID=A0A1E4TEW4_9ASCO|nr:hypothetical protein CANCADRAFT_25844 [Tortispora caseinolytica NRRL Y-17796]
MKVYIVRHGETDHNRQRIYQGQLDTEINAVGKDQVRKCSRREDLADVEYVYSSDLKRCRMTSELLFPKHKDCGLIEYDSRLRERYMGALQGMSIDEGRALLAAEHKSTADFGETKQEMDSRLLSFWDSAIKQVAAENKYEKVCIVTHGGVINKLLSLLVNERQTYDFNIPENAIRVPGNTSVTIVTTDINSDGELYGTIDLMGDISHLSYHDTVDQELR